jgi:hypothetical protein
MSKLATYLILVLTGLSFQGDKSNVKKWVIAKGCSLKVDGTTNVNSFSCIISNYSKPDTILAARNNQQFVGLNGNIKLDIQNFNCHNPVMTADLRKTLKAKEFPKLIIRFISISQYPEASTRHANTKGAVVIELAGVSKRIEVDYKVVSAEGNYINLIGSQKVHFSDFKITPPSRLGGMIRTNNEISVVFDLKLKVLD